MSGHNSCVVFVYWEAPVILFHKGSSGHREARHATFTIGFHRKLSSLLGNMGVLRLGFTSTLFPSFPAVQKPIQKAQLLSYLKLLDPPRVLMFNFHEVKLLDEFSRLVLTGANISQQRPAEKRRNTPALRAMGFAHARASVLPFRRSHRSWPARAMGRARDQATGEPVTRPTILPSP